MINEGISCDILLWSNLMCDSLGDSKVTFQDELIVKAIYCFDLDLAEGHFMFNLDLAEGHVLFDLDLAAGDTAGAAGVDTVSDTEHHNQQQQQQQQQQYLA